MKCTGERKFIELYAYQNTCKKRVKFYKLRRTAEIVRAMFAARSSVVIVQ